MIIQRPRRVGLVQKLVILALLSFMAYGEKDKMVVGMNKKQHELQRQRQPQETEDEQHGKHHHPFDLYSSSKRKVPNVSDPLHNRKLMSLLIDIWCSAYFWNEAMTWGRLMLMHGSYEFWESKKRTEYLCISHPMVLSSSFKVFNSIIALNCEFCLWWWSHI